MVISHNNSTQNVNSTPDVFVIQKTRVLEVNLGLRNVSGDSGDSGIEKFWMERLIDELLKTDRNTQLLLIDQFIELFNSECMYSFVILSRSSSYHILLKEYGCAFCRKIGIQ